MSLPAAIHMGSGNGLRYIIIKSACSNPNPSVRAFQAIVEVW